MARTASTPHKAAGRRNCHSLGGVEGCQRNVLTPRIANWYIGGLVSSGCQTKLSAIGICETFQVQNSSPQSDLESRPENRRTAANPRTQQKSKVWKSRPRKGCISQHEKPMGGSIMHESPAQAKSPQTSPPK